MNDQRPTIAYDTFYRAACDMLDANLARFRAMPYEQYLRTVHWSCVRHRALKAAEWRCQECGARYGLEVHHLHYDTIGRETLDDVAVLCEECHEAKHPERRHG